MSIAHNPVQHERTKYIEINSHFIKDNLDRGLTKYIEIDRHFIKKIILREVWLSQLMSLQSFT